MNTSTRPLKRFLGRVILVVLLAIAFGYIEAAVVVYLRQIFHPNGFNFPLAAFLLSDNSRNLLTVEAAREAATLILIFSASLLLGQNRLQRIAYFMIIFAVWDIFYYVFLKLILDWPASVMDWDILFLIPLPWASPVLAPLLVSISLILFAAIILYRDLSAKPLKVTLWDWLGFSLAALALIVSFCIAGRRVAQPDYAAHFYWPLFTAGLLAALAFFAKCLYNQPGPAHPSQP